MAIEFWKPIVGYPSYAVSNCGRIRNTGTGRILKVAIKPHGYAYVTLCENKIKKYMRVSRLVATAFIPNPKNKSQVNHIDNIRSNDRVENLEWVTQHENMRHCSNQNRQWPKKRPVMCTDAAGISKVYESIASVVIDGFWQGNVVSCLQGRLKTCGKCTWKYL